MNRVLPLSLLTASLGLAQLVRLWLGPLPGWLYALPVLCPLRALTGIACPTCGLGRSLAFTWTLDLAAGWSHHPLGPLALLVCVASALTHLLSPPALANAGRKLAGFGQRHRGWMALLCAAYVVWGFAR